MTKIKRPMTIEREVRLWLTIITLASGIATVILFLPLLGGPALLTFTTDDATAIFPATFVIGVGGLYYVRPRTTKTKGTK